MEQIQNFAPVIIPTLNRYEHFKRCIESLSRCTWAEETEVYVGLDFPPSEKYREGYEKINNYLENCGSLGFKQLHVIKRERNYGASANWEDLKQMAYLKSDTYIGSEDDNEFSPCFLDFMNKALCEYKDNPKVMSVCGYVPASWEGVFNQGVLFNYDSGAYGIGWWKYKEPTYDLVYYQTLWEKHYWKIFWTSPSVAMMFMTMIKTNQKWGDVMNSCSNMIEKRYQVRPFQTLVRQCGQDGSGMHSGNDGGKEMSRSISIDKTFVLSGRYLDNILPRRYYFNYFLPSNMLKNCFIVFKYFVKSFLVRCNIVSCL